MIIKDSGLRLSIERWKAEKELVDSKASPQTKDMLLSAKLEGKIEAYLRLLGE